MADTVHLCAPNDIDAVEDTLKRDNDVACVIIEPTGGAFGMTPTRKGFLTELREVTSRYGVLLIFDEVVTGFRCAPGGAQAYFGVTPDLTTNGEDSVRRAAGWVPGGAGRYHEASGIPGGARSGICSGRCRIRGLSTQTRFQRQPELLC